MIARILLYFMLIGAVIAPASAALPSDIPRDAIAKHKIKKGDNLYLIAKRYNVDIRNIIRANKLKPPYTIRIGSSLQIPGAAYHIVKKGQSLIQISNKYNVSLRSLVTLNKLKKPYVIRPEQKIYLPEPTEIVTEKPPEKIEAKKPTPAVKVSLQHAPLPPHLPQAAPQALPRRKVSLDYAPQPTNQAPVAAVIDDDFKDNGAAFLPPVEGKIISRFGAQGLGVHNDGVNFATKKGQKVRSSRDGIVAYSDDGLRRLGNLIIIRHAGGYMTVYAHNDKNLVKSGESVRRGQVIAISGNSGGVNRPQLHFQILKNERTINPEKYIGG